MRNLFTFCLLATTIFGCSGTSSAQSGAPKSGVNFVFTAAGDYGFSGDSVATLEGIGRASAKFHLALGDLSYGGARSETKWCDLVKSRVGVNFPFELVAGNQAVRTLFLQQP